jgi:uncharacterized protein YcbX
MPMPIELSGLFLYPVKSLRGLSLAAAEVDARGLRLDRHWMLVDPEGRFVTQRQQPRMALIDCAPEAEGLRLAAPNMAPLRLDAPAAGAETLEVQLWGQRCQALAWGAEADAWLSHFLQRPVRLVAMPEGSVRRLDPEYAQPQDQTGFADGFPFLLISEASLADLNQRVGRVLPMQRFRPNLVVSGCAPYAEDRWRRIRIGGIEFRLVKPCSRCSIPSVDPATGARDGTEPLATLSRYRQRGNKVYFGQNLIHDGAGRLALGDGVEVLETA